MAEGYAGSRKVLERGGSLTVGIPKAIVDRYGIEKGDDVFWSDREGADRPMFIPPGRAEPGVERGAPLVSLLDKAAAVGTDRERIGRVLLLATSSVS